MSHLVIIQIIEPGNKSVQPSVNVFTVNEAFSSIEVFEIDAATGFVGVGSSRRLFFDGAHPIVYGVLCARQRNEEWKKCALLMKNPSTNKSNT